MKTANAKTKKKSVRFYNEVMLKRIFNVKNHCVRSRGLVDLSSEEKGSTRISRHNVVRSVLNKQDRQYHNRVGATKLVIRQKQQ
jgi:hypothetical protein